MFVDSHCHLAFQELACQIDEVVARMHAANVGAAINICTSIEEFPAVAGLAERRPEIWATVGVHPDSQSGQEPDVADLVRLAAHPHVVAIGETGLDYYRLKEPLDWQRERFRTHIRAARATGLPLVIHTRAAAEDTLRIMREEKAEQVGGVLHCFTETPAVAQAAIEMGFFISFSGILTFPNAAALRAVAAELPLDRILIETDAPYLAPVPYRGRPNEPAYVVQIAQALCKLRGLSLAEVEHQTTSNFFNLFNKLK